MSVLEAEKVWAPALFPTNTEEHITGVDLGLWI